MIPFLILTLVAVFGMFMFFRGWWGNRIDDHPICRRCGFDLFGLPEGVTRCSECGADLTRPWAIRGGHRARRPALIGSGLFLVLVSTAALAAIGWARAKDFDPNPWKPFAWVLSEASATSPPAMRAQAFAELRRRISAGELSQARLDRLADVGLARQADLTQTWLPEWGEIIETIHAAGQLSDDRWKRYAKQSGSFALQLRPQVRRGDPIPVRVARGPARVGGTRNTGGLWQEMHFEGLEIAGFKQHAGGSIGSSLHPSGGGSGGWSPRLKPEQSEKLQPGPQPVRLSMIVKIFERPSWSFKPDGPPIVEYPVELEGTFELVEPDVQTVTLIDAPERADAVRAAVKIRDGAYERSREGEVEFMIDVTASPVTLAHDVIVRAGGREVKMGTITCRAGTGTSTNVNGKLPDLRGDRVDIVLRPSLDAAHATTELVELWDGEVVIPNVKVARYDPATRPTR